MQINPLAVLYDYPAKASRGMCHRSAKLDNPDRQQYITNVIPIMGCCRVDVAVELMSGTSRDGIDPAIVQTDGNGTAKPVAFASLAYSPEVIEAQGFAYMAVRRMLGYPTILTPGLLKNREAA